MNTRNNNNTGGNRRSTTSVETLLSALLGTNTGTNTNTRNINTINVNNETDNRILTILDDAMYDYNRNMSSYQNNMRDIINTIQSIHYVSTPNHMPVPRNHIYQNDASSSQNPMQSNSSLQNPMQSNSSSQNPQDISGNPLLQDLSTNPLFSYFFYPHTSSDINASADASNNAIIQRATRTILYDPSATEIVNCPISLDDFVRDESITEILPCRHLFRTSYLMTWLNRDMRCPSCRYNLHSYIDISMNRQPVHNLQTTPTPPQPSLHNSLLNVMNNMLSNYQNGHTDAQIYTFELPLFETPDNPEIPDVD